MSIQPWRPTVILAPQVDQSIWNALISYSGQPVKIPGSEAHLTFQVVSPVLGDVALLRVQSAGEMFVWVHIQDFPFKALFGVDLRVSQLASLPASLRDAFHRALLSFLWDLLPDHQGVSWSFEEKSLDAASSESLTWLSCQVSGLAAESVFFTLGVSMPLALTYIMHGKLAPFVLWPAVEENFFYDVYYTLGSLELSFDDLSRLKQGDVMVFDEAVTQEVRVRVDDTLYRCALGEEALTCTHVETRKARKGY